MGFRMREQIAALRSALPTQMADAEIEREHASGYQVAYTVTRLDGHTRPYSVDQADGVAGQTYRERIAGIIESHGFTGIIDPRFVEAWMRVERSTFDALSENQFDDLANESIELVINTTSDVSERLAQSFGLMSVTA
jgi:hypothetical protein